MKTVLRKVLPPHLLKFEELNTILTSVEATLNSRPLMPIDSTPADRSIVLTPGHFIAGRPLKALPLSTVEELSLTPLKRWKRVRYITQQIWRQWKKAYLQTLQSREKWRGPTPNIQVGDCILKTSLSERNMHHPKDCGPWDWLQLCTPVLMAWSELWTSNVRDIHTTEPSPDWSNFLRQTTHLQCLPPAMSFF